MAKMRFVYFHGAVQWLIHGDTVPVFEPVEFYPPDEPLFAHHTEGDFYRTFEDLESDDGSMGAESLAEELILDAAVAGRIRLIGTTLRDPDDMQLVDPAFIAGSSFEYDDGAMLYNDEKTIRHLHVSLDDMLEAFPFRPSEWRKSAPEPSNTLASTPDVNSSRPEADGGVLARNNIKMTAAKIHQCKALLNEFVMKNETPCVKSTARQIAMQQIPGLSRRGFDKAWDATVPDHWKIPGRKSKH